MTTTTPVFGWPDILALVVYFALVLGVGFWATCRANTGSAQGYFLAGQGSNWWLIGTSTFATNIGAPMFIGLAGSAAASGISVVMFEWHAMFMLVALGWIFLPVYRASGCYTMPQYLKLRYGGNRIRVLLAVMNIAMAIMAWIASQMYAGAIFITEIFKWDLYLSVVLIVGVTALYTVIGGLTAVLWTDAIQTVILIIGAFITAIIGLNRVGGWEGITNQYPLSASNETILDYSLYGNRTCGLPREDAFHIFRAPTADYPWPGMILGLTILATNAWCTDQICVQRSLSAKSVSHAKGGVLLAAYLKILPFLFFIIPGMTSRILYPDEVACANPQKCQEVCGNPSGCSNNAYPFLVSRILPTGLRGLMLAALLSALMSSLTSIFNSSSTLFTLDIYKRIRSKASERELMVVGRVYILVLVGVSILWLPILQALQGAQLWTYTQSMYSYILPPFVACFYLGLFWPRATEKGAFCGILVGLGMGIIRIGLTFSRPSPPCGSTEPDTSFPIVTNVNYLHYAVISLVVSMFVVILVSLVTEPRTPGQLRRVTFWTRTDPELQDVTEEDKEDDDFTRDDGKDENSPVDDTPTDGKLSLKQKFLKYVCGIDKAPKPRLTREEMMDLQRKATNIKEDPWWKKMLNYNAVLALAACVFLHAFFA